MFLSLGLSSSTDGTFPNFTAVFKEPSIALSWFKVYEPIIPVLKALETASFDVYTEIFCSQTCMTGFLRRRARMLLVLNALADVSGDLAQTLCGIKRMSVTLGRKPVKQECKS